MERSQAEEIIESSPIPEERPSGIIAVDGIYPRSTEEIVARVAGFNQNRNSGRLHELATRVGLDEEWVNQQHQRPLYFGPAEQSNPFFTVYSMGRAGGPTPESLHQEIIKQKEIEKILNEVEGIRAQMKLLTLRYDSASSAGATANYHFELGQKTSQNLLTQKAFKKEFPRLPFEAMHFPVSQLEEAIKNLEKNFSTDKKQKGKFIVYAEKNSIDPNSYAQAAQYFIDDLKETISRVRAKDKKAEAENIGYYDFTTEYNKLTLARFAPDGQIETYAADDGTMDSLPILGVKNWDILLNSLAEKKLIDLEKDPILRYTVPYSDGTRRYIRLAVANNSLQNGKVTEENIQLTNLDYRPEGHYGEPSYQMDQVLKSAQDDFLAGQPSLFASKSVKYFLMLSGINNIMMGDDGVYSEGFHKFCNGVSKFGIEKPLVFTYSPHNIGLDGYKVGFEFNESCSIVNFYLYMLELKRLKESTRDLVELALATNAE